MTPEERAALVVKQLAYSRTPAGRATQRRSHIKGRYGITSDQYDKMLADQGGTCALCPNEISPYGRRLSIDHDHVTGRVRGILCLRCNNQISLIDRVGVNGVLAYLASNPLGT